MRELGLNWPGPRVQSQDVFHFLPTKVITSLFSSLQQRGASVSPLILILQRLSFKGRDLFSKIYKVEVFNFLASVGLKDTILRLKGPDTMPNIHRPGFTSISE
jgi:hypothetical protein